MQQTQFPKIKVLPWSTSSLSAFETCPRRVWLMKTKQASERQSTALAEGNRVHKALENALNGTAGLPPDYRKYQPVIDRIKEAPGVKQAERNFALTASFKPTEYWGPEAWVRGKIDVTISRIKTALVIDWKNGKPKEEDDQAKVYAGVLFAERPHIERVHTAYGWLTHNKMTPRTFERAEAPGIWSEFAQRVRRMVHAADTDDFPPKPSGLCREYCPVGRKLCEFCGAQ
jgi:CRISPR/Cas system-associated exonuclease Cas4 (RecB family)